MKEKQCAAVSMQAKQKAAYNKGYSLGYQTGYADGRNDAIHGVDPAYVSDDILKLPIQDMDLSSRAFNCLVRAGYKYIGDVAALRDTQIRVMRNLGKVSANEIAQALRSYGILHTDWDLYLSF